MNELVSIIVPTYNSSAFDGSKDTNISIYLHYKTYQRIKEKI